MSQPESSLAASETTDRRALADYMAEQICRGFRHHDRGERAAAVDAFYAVDRRQFRHADDDATRAAARAYVDALWAKDRIEDEHTTDGELDREAVGRADWRPVERAFTERAEAVGIDRRYAECSTTAWRRHKTGGDYWTPTARAQRYELRAALQDPDYPRKGSDGRGGPGPEPMRYVLAVELHDMHTRGHWAQARAVMRPYYERILEAHGVP